MDWAKGEAREYLSKAKQQDPTVVSAAAVGHTASAEPLPALLLLLQRVHLLIRPRYVSMFGNILHHIWPC